MVIILEGISGAGKTTQAVRLLRWLRRSGSGMLVREFSSGLIGGLITRTYKRRRERFLRFHENDRFADQTYLLLLADSIAKAEEASCATEDVVLIDRLFDSWLCYAQAGENRLALDDRQVWDLYCNCVKAHLPSDAVTVFLEVEVDTAIRRLNDREDFGVGAPDRERLVAVARNFEELYNRSPAIRVPADREPVKVTATILEAIGLRH